MAASEPTIETVCGMSGVLEDALTVEFLKLWLEKNFPAGNDAGGGERETK